MIRPLLLAAVLLALTGCGDSPERPADPAALATDTTAASAPSTDIYLAPLTREGGTLSVGAPVNATRRAGYDNQPHFLPDGQTILYTSVRDEQAETFAYDLAEDASRQITDTPESEYSPTPHAGGFSAVRVEADGTQRLWQFTSDGASPEVLLPDVQPVGYHAWASDGTVALFVLGEPPTLQLADLEGGTADTLARGIGRSLQRMPGEPLRISFVRQSSDSTSAIRALDPATQEIETLVETRAGGDFHTWLPDGTLLMADGAALYAWHPERADQGWRPVATLPLQDITRLAVSPDGDRLALVAADAAPPASVAE